ncbi:hypothetical protein HJC23_008837 [Cyclotella cryptica]|uniref:HRDC domain-containing protein n=1 Tax=Cyclotella cryptica TaxID=29204 RepID=A0ABD3Q923_9STRA|eukprot:CCRYP_007489-RB/>CCRYP_007489-RB protein AED:0.04 eAED:0.04 QI:365/1/1/1/0.33/0.5/4/434/1022
MTEEETPPSLPALLSALALGARSVSSLPLAESSSNGNDDNDNDEDEDANETNDEFAFRMSLPEFASLNHEARRLLSSLLRRALNDDDDENDAQKEEEEEEEDLSDPVLWEKCADACEAVLDRVALYIDRREGKEKDELLGSWTEAVGGASDRARREAEGKYGRMIRGVVDMEKPQNVYQGFVTHPPQNSRLEPFHPLIAFDASKQALLDEGKFNREGHGLNTRYHGMEARGSSVPSAITGEDADDDDGNDNDNMLAPSYHVEHPFREEIEALEYRDWQFDLSGVDAMSKEKLSSNNDSDRGVWIGTEDDLFRLAKRIADEEDIREIAIDLEAHSHRTFAGFVCLIQLSIRRHKPLREDRKGITNDGMDNDEISTGHDFLIDALSLRHAISTTLGPVLADPNILKVMHGADSDIPWLQRDFGCYVVNLFDTGRASRALKFPSAGLAYLLRKYARVEADKTHQLSDWRRRPLPEDMRTYAVNDTKYLLDIYDQLRLELENHPSADISIRSVLDRSKDVCLIRYDKEPFRPLGYKYIMDGGRRHRANNKGIASYLKGRHEVISELSPQQVAALKALYDWRDKTARQEDESVQYVCPNPALLRIASNRPVTVAALQRLVNPPPPLVLRKSQEILEILNAVKTSSSAAASGYAQELEIKKSTSADTVPLPTPSARNREMLSPILGSDVLYQKAGWMTPSSEVNVTSESEEDESKRRFLEVNNANQGYESSHFSSHCLDLSPQIIDPNDETMKEDKPAGFNATAEDLRKGRRNARLIQNEMAKALALSGKSKFGNGFNLMEYIRPNFREIQNEDTSGNGEDITPNSYDNTDVDDMVIPKSMNEIYNLSNANRRRTNKEKSPKALETKENASNIQQFKEDDINGAEAVLASRGGPGGYFGENKRQRTDTMPPGKEGDVELMIKMGWVKDKEDAESLAATPNATSDQGEPEQKLTSKKTGGNTKRPQEGGRGGSGVIYDYYSTVGTGIGAYDPNAPPVNNPFFVGAATSAASLFTGEHKNPKSGKRNKKR